MMKRTTFRTANRGSENRKNSEKEGKHLYKIAKCNSKAINISIVDPEWFIPDPDPATNFRVPDADPTYIIKANLEIIYKKTLNSIKRRIY